MIWARRVLVLAVLLPVSLGVGLALAAPAGPVGQWHLDGSGVDSSGNAHNGVVTGGRVVPGAVGSAYDFSAGGFIRVTSAPDLEPTSLTVSAWVKNSASPGAFRYIVLKGQSGCTAASYALYSGGSGGLSFYVFDGSVFVLSPDAGVGVWDGQWHRVVGTYDGSMVRLYVDGAEVGAGSPTTLAIAYALPTDRDFVIGTSPSACGGGTSSVAIDEVNVWARAIDSAETAPANTPGGGASKRRAGMAASLAGPDEIPLAVETLVRSALASLALMGLVVFPSQLFNSTLEANYDEVTGWFARATRPFAPLGRFARKGLWDSWAGFAVMTAVTGVLYGLLSPSFGLNAGSANAFAGIVAATVVVTLLFALPMRRYMRSHFGDKGHIHVLPSTAAIALVCVVVSRLAHFQPGYLYGLLAGFVYSVTPGPEDKGRVVARCSAWILGAAVLAWLVRTPLDSLADKGSLGTFGLVADAVLAAVFVAGVESLVFALVPLRFLSGEALFRWDKRRWTLLFGAGVFLFVHVLLSHGSGYLASRDSTPMTTVIGLTLAFGAVSVAFWAYFRFRSAPDAPSASAGSPEG